MTTNRACRAALGSGLVATALVLLVGLGAATLPSHVSADPTATAEFATDRQIKKERRLNIAGWTLIGTGIAYPVIIAPFNARDDLNCEAGDCELYVATQISYFLGPTMALIGMGLVIRRHKLRKRREATQGFLIAPKANGIVISGRF